MTLAIPPGYASVRMDFRRNAESDLKSVIFGVKSGHTAAAIAVDVDNAYDAAGSLRSIIPSSLTLVSVTAYKGNDGPLLVGTVNPGTAGTGANDDLCSPAVSFVLKKRTEFAGQRFRGRLMLPFATEAAVDSAGVVSGAKVTAISAAGAVFLTELAIELADAAGMVVLHDEELGPVTPTPVTTLTCRSTVGTVRRRQVIG